MYPPPPPMPPQIKYVSHALHFLLGIPTFGLWWVMWVVIVIITRKDNLLERERFTRESQEYVAAQMAVTQSTYEWWETRIRQLVNPPRLAPLTPSVALPIPHPVEVRQAVPPVPVSGGRHAPDNVGTRAIPMVPAKAY